jgi:DNA-binding transcriptional regulator YiaG
MNVKTQFEDNYTDYGFGFPIVIDHVEIAEIGGEKFPLIDYRELETRAIESLPGKPFRLTGGEVRFIRHHFGMTLEVFGKRLGVSHVAVRKWEQKASKPAGMQWATEKNLRLFIARLLGETGESFVSLFDALEDKRAAKSIPLRLSLERWNPFDIGEGMGSDFEAQKHPAYVESPPKVSHQRITFRVLTGGGISGHESSPVMPSNYESVPQEGTPDVSKLSNAA